MDRWDPGEISLCSFAWNEKRKMPQVVVRHRSQSWVFSHLIAVIQQPRTWSQIRDIKVLCNIDPNECFNICCVLKFLMNLLVPEKRLFPSRKCEKMMYHSQKQTFQSSASAFMTRSSMKTPRSYVCVWYHDLGDKALQYFIYMMMSIELLEGHCYFT